MRRVASALLHVALGSASGCGSAPHAAGAPQQAAPVRSVTTVQVGPVHMDVPLGSPADEGGLARELRVFESPGSTFEVAQAAAVRMNATNVAGERTSDGHWISFDRPGSVGPTFGVQVVRRFEGHVYVCEGLFARAEDARVALAICRTMRP